MFHRLRYRAEGETRLTRPAVPDGRPRITYIYIYIYTYTYIYREREIRERER